MANKIHARGFMPDEIRAEDFVFGALQVPHEKLQEDGQWDDYLPKDEMQKKFGVETQNCTNYGTLNCLEAYYLRKYGERHNWSERYTGVLTGTTKTGNSPHKVIEEIRKMIGVIPEEMLPFTDEIDTWEKYYSPDPMNKKYIEVGHEWLRHHKILHEWVFTSSRTLDQKRKLLMDALKDSPLGVSVKAWRKKDGLYWKNEGEQDNHWVMLYGYEEGKYWKVFDSYDSTKKKLRWNYDFMFAKRYYIKQEEQETAQQSCGIWQRFYTWLLGLLGIQK